MLDKQRNDTYCFYEKDVRIMKKVKWGIIGLGNIAHKFADAIQSVDNAKLAAVASRSLQKSQVFGSKYAIDLEKCYDSYESLVQDTAIDAIYVALPNSLHKQVSILAMEHKKAVLCEKPATTNQNDLIQILDVAQKYNVFFMEAMKNRFTPVIKSVKKQLENNSIGMIKYIQADQTFMSEFDPNHHLYQKHMGGGALLDIGVYPLSLYQYLFNQPLNNIKSYLSYDNHPVDIAFSLSAQNTEEVHIQLFASIQALSSRNFLIGGTQGFIEIPMFSNPQSYRISINNHIETYEFKHPVNGLEYQIEEASKCILNNQLESTQMTWHDSLTVSGWVDTIFEQQKRDD